jgi:hypothetical protein
MKTHVLKAKFIVAAQHLRLPIGTKRERRVPTPNGMLPKMWKRLGCLQKIAGKESHVFSRLNGIRQSACDSAVT